MHENSIAIDSSPVTSSVSSATQEFLKAADPGNGRKKRAAVPLNNEASSSTSERPLAEIISEKFSPFDSAMYIIAPFDAESARDMTVDEEYTTMLLDAVIQTHAWASARFKRKAQLECQKLEDQNSRIMKTEKEQENVREGLADFVTKMKKALAALTGVEA